MAGGPRVSREPDSELPRAKEPERTRDDYDSLQNKNHTDGSRRTHAASVCICGVRI